MRWKDIEMSIFPKAMDLVSKFRFLTGQVSVLIFNHLQCHFSAHSAFPHMNAYFVRKSPNPDILH